MTNINSYILQQGNRPDAQQSLRSRQTKIALIPVSILTVISFIALLSLVSFQLITGNPLCTLTSPVSLALFIAIGLTLLNLLIALTIKTVMLIKLKIFNTLTSTISPKKLVPITPVLITTSFEEQSAEVINVGGLQQSVIESPQPIAVEDEDVEEQTQLEPLIEGVYPTGISLSTTPSFDLKGILSALEPFVEDTSQKSKIPLQRVFTYKNIQIIFSSHPLREKSPIVPLNNIGLIIAQSSRWGLSEGYSSRSLNHYLEEKCWVNTFPDQTPQGTPGTRLPGNLKVTKWEGTTLAKKCSTYWSFFGQTFPPSWETTDGNIENCYKELVKLYKTCCQKAEELGCNLVQLPLFSLNNLPVFTSKSWLCMFYIALLNGILEAQNERTSTAPLYVVVAGLKSNDKISQAKP